MSENEAWLAMMDKRAAKVIAEYLELSCPAGSTEKKAEIAMRWLEARNNPRTKIVPIPT